MASEPARHWIVATTGCGVWVCRGVNALALRGRHFGWVALSAVVAMAVAGYYSVQDVTFRGREPEASEPGIQHRALSLDSDPREDACCTE